MRQITVSVFALFIILPAFADVRLPVVNLAAGSVSARAAFGEPIVKNEAKVSQNKEINVSENNESKIKNNDKKRSVVARSSVQKPIAVKTTASKDSGEQIIASADVLVPRRPSSDLWARNDAPLRLPSPDEFSVIKSDFELPEESIDSSSRNAVVARGANVAQPVRSVQTKTEPLSEIDAQIARLNELQRRADESVQKKYVPVQTASIEHEDFFEEDDIEPVSIKTARTEERKIADKTDDVKLSRLVVPMEEDVVVRAVEKAESPRIMSVREDMTKMSPSELRKAFRKTFLSENKHLSTFQIDDRFDVASDMTSNIEGFTSARDLSEAGGIRPLEIKIKFRNDDSALSRDNYNLLTEYAGIVLSNPTRAIQVSIPESATHNSDDRKLAARRLAIVEQVLRDTGVSEQRILPVLSQRDEEGFVLRMISLDQYETLTKKQRDMFGDTISKKTYKSMSW